MELPGSLGDLVPAFTKVAPQTLDVGAELIERTRGLPVVQVHVSDGGEIDLSAFELAHGGAQDLAPLAGGPRFRKLEDRVAHDFKLPSTLLGLRLARPSIHMDLVWVWPRSFNLA